MRLKTKDSNENLPEQATNPVNSTGSAICVEAQLHERPLTNKSPIKLQSVEQAIDDKSSGRKGSSLQPNNKQTNKQINEISAAIESARLIVKVKTSKVLKLEQMVLQLLLMQWMKLTLIK